MIALALLTFVSRGSLFGIIWLSIPAAALGFATGCVSSLVAVTVLLKCKDRWGTLTAGILSVVAGMASAAGIAGAALFMSNNEEVARMTVVTAMVEGLIATGALYLPASRTRN